MCAGPSLAVTAVVGAGHTYRVAVDGAVAGHVYRRLHRRRNAYVWDADRLDGTTVASGHPTRREAIAVLVEHHRT